MSPAALEAPKTSPQTLGCSSRGDHWSHPLTAPNQGSTQEERRWTEKRQETVEVLGNKGPREVGRGLWGSLKRDCPRWCAPWWRGSSTPVHFPDQHAPPIPLGQGRKESRTKELRGETQRCFCEAVLH